MGPETSAEATATGCIVSVCLSRWTVMPGAGQTSLAMLAMSRPDAPRCKMCLAGPPIEALLRRPVKFIPVPIHIISDCPRTPFSQRPAACSACQGSLQVCVFSPSRASLLIPASAVAAGVGTSAPMSDLHECLSSFHRHTWRPGPRRGCRVARGGRPSVITGLAGRQAHLPRSNTGSAASQPASQPATMSLGIGTHVSRRGVPARPDTLQGSGKPPGKNRRRQQPMAHRSGP